MLAHKRNRRIIASAGFGVLPMDWLKGVMHSVLRLAVGEVLARLASFALVAYITRHYGLDLLGALALAQTVTMYVMQGTDQGFRLIGARIVGRDASLALRVVPLITRRRIVTGTLCVAAGLAYALWGPMPPYARFCVAGFVIGLLPYAVSLDWLAWGLSHFGWLGSWRAGVAFGLAAGSLLGFQFISDPRLSLVSANLVSMGLGSLLLWIVWRRTWRNHLPPASSPDDAVNQLRWGATLSLGLAVILTQMFHNFDTVILGAMAPLGEVGRYSAAYRILFLVCSAFYLLTQAIYPRLSASKGGAGTRKVLLLAVAAAAIGGSLIAAILCAFAHPILTIIYGSDLGATRLLRILVFAVPMDFVAALFGVSFTSRGFERFLLFACGSAALFNIGSNLILIPRMGAEGAAVATILSYILLILVLFAGFAVKPIFAEGSAIADALAEQN